MDINALKNRNFVLMIDRSGSMSDRDTGSGKSRWEEAHESTVAIANRVSEIEPGGITVYTFTDNFKKFDNVNANMVAEIFNQEPMGGTTLAPALKDVFTTYLANKRAGKTKLNGELLICVTDGMPSDEDNVARTISQFTQQLQDGRTEFGIEFIQVGKDKHAHEFLERLNDNLTKEGAKYDIVNSTTMEDVGNTPLVDILIRSLTQ